MCATACVRVCVCEEGDQLLKALPPIVCVCVCVCMRVCVGGVGR